MTRKRSSKIYTALALAVMLALLVPWTVVADNVVNDVDTSTNTATITAGGSTDVEYWIVATSGDSQPGCNASDGSPATVTINAPSGVTATPGSLTFTNCGTGFKQKVTFSSSSVGEYLIGVSVNDSGTGSYNTNPARFTLKVNAAPAPADTTAPTIDITTPPNNAVYKLNQVVNADYSCTDEAGGSGLESCTGDVANGAQINTSSVGTKTFTVNAEDKAGNTSSKSHTYKVIFDWTGFFQPVDNNGVLNQVKAGSAIPVKFSLNGNQGLGIFASGSPGSAPIACDPTATADPIEQTVTAGSSSLSYDAAADQYTYVWKTDKSWTGCRQLTVKLIDGQEYKANFRFTK